MISCSASRLPYASQFPPVCLKPDPRAMVTNGLPALLTEVVSSSSVLSLNPSTYTLPPNLLLQPPRTALGGA